jgi:2-iminoacetate synthase
VDDFMENPLDFLPSAPPSDPRLLALLDHPEFGAGGPLDAAILQCAIARKQALFGGRIEAIAPLYVSSYCREHCTYCNYRAGNKDQGVVRKRLNDDELRREVEFLAGERGIRFIELVYASDPHLRFGEMARQVALVARWLEAHGGGRVGLSAEPLEASEYRALRDAGLTLSVLWMETYHPARYAETHPGPGAKPDQTRRRNAYAAMLAAGIPEIGMGVLSGLGPWRDDWRALLRHELELHAEFGRGPAVLGIPRMQPAIGALSTATDFRPTDSEFRALVALHNLFAPDCRPFVSTREEWDFCVDLARGGGCLFTFNCSTIPGGYALGSAGYQFRTGDYDMAQYRLQAEQLGFEVV